MNPDKIPDITLKPTNPWVRYAPVFSILAVILFLWYIAIQKGEIDNLTREVTRYRIHGNPATIGTTLENLSRENQELKAYKEEIEESGGAKETLEKINVLELNITDLQTRYDIISKEYESVLKENNSLKEKVEGEKKSGSLLSLREEQLAKATRERDDYRKKYEQLELWKRNYEIISEKSDDQQRTISQLQSENLKLKEENRRLISTLARYDFREKVHENTRRAQQTASIRMGDSRETVKKVLGSPISISKYPTFEYWRYDNSRSVEFDRHGRVIDAMNIKLLP